MSTTVDLGDAPTPPENPVGSASRTVLSHLHPRASWDLGDHPEPVGTEEVWRFTPMHRVKPLFQDAAPAGALTWRTRLPQGVTLGPVSPGQGRALAVEAPLDRVSALAAANAPHPVHLAVPAGAELTEPVILEGTGTGGPVAEHLVVTVARHAKATVVLRHQGSARYAAKVDVRVGEGASLNFVSVQGWDDDAVHGGQTSFLIGRDAHVRTVDVSLGGDLVRIVGTARYEGPGGSLEQFGLYFVDAGQHIEHRLLVDHNEPRTTSNVDYRGALQGAKAHSVWVGDVLIRPEAVGISTYEQNRNLLLTDGAWADSVPNLEIETGEIEGAGHSSTTGRFDDEQLFYLTSRGIEPLEAKRLVVHGFFADIIRRIGVPDLEAKLLEDIEGELAVTMGSGAPR